LEKLQLKILTNYCLRKLTDKVCIAKVWEKSPKPTDDIISNSDSLDVFFINEMGNYIGAVLDMGHDLHWYIKPKFRKKGHLSTALKTAILPYLFNSRRELRITISKFQIGQTNYHNSKIVANKLGFKKVSNNKYEEVFILKKQDFNTQIKVIKGENSSIGKERIDTLCRRANYSAQLLKLIKDELDMNYGESANLNRIINEIDLVRLTIEDLMYKIEN